MEEWRISKIFPKYEVSSNARVRNIITREYVDIIWGKARAQIILDNNGIHEKYHLDEIVADAFYDTPHEDKKVIHINDNRQDNRPGNLEWVSKNYRKTDRISYRDTKVRCIETGEEYCNLYECSEDLGVPLRKIALCMNSNVLMARSKTTGQVYSFERVD